LWIVDFVGLLSSYLRRLRGGVGWQVIVALVFVSSGFCLSMVFTFSAASVIHSLKIVFNFFTRSS
jgi:hypothetical protein